MTSILVMPRIFIIPSMVLKIAGSVSSDIVSLMMVFVIEAGICFIKSSREIFPDTYFLYKSKLSVPFK